MEPLISAGKVKILAQLGREKDPDYPDVPLILDLAATPADRQILELAFTQQVMAWPLVAPPGVPRERIAALRAAFDATMRDPDFLAEAARQKLIINPVSGEKIAGLLDRIYASPKDVLDRVAALSARNPGYAKSEAQTSEAVNHALGDLRVFIKQVETRGELMVVRHADPHLEIGALYELSQEETYPPALMFEAMKGCDPGFRILCNVRNARLLVGDLTLDALKAYRRRPRRELEPIPPREVATGPVLRERSQEGDEVDILKFPAPQWHAGDGGRYIGTECLVITKDPDSDWVNIGTYRVMVVDRRTLTVFIEPGKQGDVIRRKYWAKGLPCPMAISVGQAPILGMMAGTAFRPGESEYAQAGARIGRPIDVVRGKITRLPIPADAELVLEGLMPPPEQESRPRRSVRRMARLLHGRLGRSRFCKSRPSIIAMTRSSSASRRPSRTMPAGRSRSRAWRRSGMRWRRRACRRCAGCGTCKAAAIASCR